MAKVSVEQAKKLFDEWRQGQSKGRSAPAKLRMIALTIRAQHGERIARDALGLSSETFWRWGRLEAKKNGTQSRGRRKPVSKVALTATQCSPLQFVEVTQTAKRAQVDSSLEISFERADGARMKLRGAIEPSQIERLAGRFLNRTLST